MSQQTFQTNPYTLLANEPRELGNLITVLIVESAVGFIYFKTTDGYFKAFGGRMFQFTRPTKVLSVTSPIAQTIELTVGEGLILFNADWANNGGTTPPTPTEVEGVDPLDSVLPRASFANPIGVQMLQNVGLPFYHSHPLQSIDGLSLSVGQVNTAKGFYESTPAVEDTRLYQMIRLSLFTFVGGPGNMYVTHGGGIPLPVYNTDGTVFSATGVIPSTSLPTKEYLVPTQGIMFLDITADPTMTAVYAIGYSPQAFLPI